MTVLWRRLVRRLTRERHLHVSSDWLSACDRQTSRIEFNGPRIQFPVKKLINHESPRMTAARLRRRA